MSISAIAAFAMWTGLLVASMLWPGAMGDGTYAIVQAGFACCTAVYLVGAMVRRLRPVIIVGMVMSALSVAVILMPDDSTASLLAPGLSAGSLAMIGASGFAVPPDHEGSGRFWSRERWPATALSLLGMLAFVSFIVASVGGLSHGLDAAVALFLAFAGLFSMLAHIFFYGVLALSMRTRSGIALAVVMVFLTVLGIVVVGTSGGAGAGYFVLMSIVMLAVMVVWPFGKERSRSFPKAAS
ncbi:hypothetical protein [Corynebacterium xerosis]|uniref:hypothetical protein n=1 Tax=Corynebacterium xerosis TaxID=1725 RepID=UPI001968FD4D|nr:hypothetical protein [Corynebacterium xerosis]